MCDYATRALRLYDQKAHGPLTRELHADMMILSLGEPDPAAFIRSLRWPLSLLAACLLELASKRRGLPLMVVEQ